MKGKLLELKKKSGKTIKQTAQELNITVNTLKSYFNTDREPSIKKLCLLAEYYNVSLDYLCNHKTKNQIDTSFYPQTAKQIIKKLPMLNNINLTKLESVCDGLILGQ